MVASTARRVTFPRGSIALMYLHAIRSSLLITEFIKEVIA